MDQCSGGGEDKCLDAGCVLKVEFIGFLGKMRCFGFFLNREVEDDSKTFALSNGKDGVTFNEMRKTAC